MQFIEAQIDNGKSRKTECDFCSVTPENGVLLEKPKSMIKDGQLLISHRAKPLYVCIECLTIEAENI